MAGKPFPVRCACGRNLVCRELYGRARFFVREEGGDREVKTCPKCGQALTGIDVELVVEETNRQP